MIPIRDLNERQDGNPESRDWYLEETEDTPDFEGLTDLRKEALLFYGGKEAEVKERNAVECGDIKADGLMWKYSENLAGAMEEIFSAVSEKLCGSRLAGHMGLTADGIRELARRCEIVQSRMYGAQNIRESAVQADQTEPLARIEACLCDHGCVVALVSDAQWRERMGETPCPFADSGVRTLQIIGLREGTVIVNDFASSQGRGLAVDGMEFCSLCGLLLEVYK